MKYHAKEPHTVIWLNTVQYEVSSAIWKHDMKINISTKKQKKFNKNKHAPQSELTQELLALKSNWLEAIVLITGLISYLSSNHDNKYCGYHTSQQHMVRENVPIGRKCIMVRTWNIENIVVTPRICVIMTIQSVQCPNFFLQV